MKACAGDDELLREVESRLEYDRQAEALLEPPAPEVEAQSMTAVGGPSLVGQQLAHYKIAEKIGAGGMGEVYKAHDPRLKRDIALKVLPPEMIADAEHRRRFQREAQAIAALNHPNIVTVYSVEEAKGLPFLTMELIDGKCLSKLIPRAGLPLDSILNLAIPLADAIVTAHQRGITHRDLKPTNIMVTVDGRVKVLDFGLAKLREQESQAADLTTLSGDEITGSGRIVGTVAYMSPEQAEGKPVDERSDIFSLGIVLYEMATGEQPFKGATAVSTISSIIKDTPTPVTDLKPSLPRDLGRIVRHALTKDPERRYQTAKDIRNDLEELKQALVSRERTEGASAEASGVRSKRGFTWTWVGAAALALAVAGGAYFWWGRPRSEGTEIVKMSPATNSGHVVRDVLALSGDGRYLGYAEQLGDQVRLQLRQTATGSSVQVLPQEKTRYRGVTFSPDGNYLYVVKGEPPISTLYQLPVLGGTPKKLIADVDGPVAFSPDGKKIAFARYSPGSKTSSVIVASTDGGESKVLATRPEVGSIFNKFSWSPDGRSLAGFSRDSILLFPLEGRAAHDLRIPGWKTLESIAWLQSGRGLLVTAEEEGAELTAHHQILEVSYPGLQIRRITADLSDHHSLVVTADLATLATIDLANTFNIWVGTAANPDQVQRISGGRTQGMRGLVWTRDGRLVYADEAGLGWVMNVDGSGVRPFATDKHAVMNPSLCGPGPLFTFVSNIGNSGSRIEVGDADGTAPRKVADGGPVGFPTCTPDGRWVIYSGSKNELWKVPIDGGSPVLLTENAHQGEFSPDGKWLAFHKVDPGRPEKLAVLPMTGDAAPQELDAGGVLFHWNPDSASLTVVKTDGEVGNLWNLPLEGKAKQITHFTSDLISAFALSQDGRIAITRGGQARDVVLIRRNRS